MRHQFIDALEKALGWPGAQPLGGDFGCGTFSDADLPSRLLTPYRLLDLIMRRSLSAPQLRCFSNGSELHPNRYYGDQVTRRGQSIRMVDMRRLENLLAAGCTLVLDELDVFDPTLEVTCRALQWWSHEIVQANAYLTTGEADGFDLHWDDHDVLVVQLAGAKDWETCRGQGLGDTWSVPAGPDVPGRAAEQQSQLAGSLARGAHCRAGPTHSARVLAPGHPPR